MPSKLKNIIYLTAALGTGLVLVTGGAAIINTSMSGTSKAAETALQGHVIYHDKDTLPPEASLIIELMETSKTTPVAKVISQTTISSINKGKVPFSLNYDATKLNPMNNYAVLARISAGDTLWFVSEAGQKINLQDMSSLLDIPVVRVRDDKDTAAADIVYDTEWLAEDLEGAGVMDIAQTTLTFNISGDVHGSGGCNRYFGKAAIDGNDVSFSPLGVTYMTCPPAMMNQERKFLEILGKTKEYTIIGSKLYLIDERGEKLARMASIQ